MEKAKRSERLFKLVEEKKRIKKDISAELESAKEEFVKAVRLETKDDKAQFDPHGLIVTCDGTLHISVSVEPNNYSVWVLDNIKGMWFSTDGTLTSKIESTITHYNTFSQEKKDLIASYCKSAETIYSLYNEHLLSLNETIGQRFPTFFGFFQ
jgi:hypothetical protein